MHVTGSRRELCVCAEEKVCVCVHGGGDQDTDIGEYRQSVMHCVYENRQQNPLLGGQLKEKQKG